jgi:hypothetical protein
VWQGVREAARRVDEGRRKQDHDADRLVTLFGLGFGLDERLEERFQVLKRGGGEPTAALPGLADFLGQPWSTEHFAEWVSTHGKADFTAAPAGRKIKGLMPGSFEDQVRQLVAALSPLSDAYPLPHFRRSG